MKRLLLPLILLAALTAAAKGKPQHTYQDAVLVSFKDVTTGSICSHSASTTGDVNATTDDDGNTNGTVKSTTDGYSNCGNRTTRRYTLQVADHTYVIEPGYVFLNKQSDLSHQLPGAKVLVRTDDKGFYVKVGDKESKFVIVEAK